MVAFVLDRLPAQRFGSALALQPRQLRAGRRQLLLHVIQLRFLEPVFRRRRLRAHVIEHPLQLGDAHRHLLRRQPLVGQIVAAQRGQLHLLANLLSELGHFRARSLQLHLAPGQLRPRRLRDFRPPLQLGAGQHPLVVELAAQGGELRRLLPGGLIARLAARSQFLLRRRQLPAHRLQLLLGGDDPILGMLFRLRRRTRAILRPFDFGRGALGMGLGPPALDGQFLQQSLVARLDLLQGRRIDGRGRGGLARLLQLRRKLAHARLVLGDLLLHPLEPLPALRLAAHQVGEQGAQRLHLRIGPGPLLAQFPRGALQIRLRLGPRRALGGEAFVQPGLRGGRLQPRFFLQRAGEPVRLLQLRPRRRLALGELHQLAAQRFELPARRALGFRQRDHLGPQRLQLCFGRGGGARGLHRPFRMPRKVV